MTRQIQPVRNRDIQIIRQGRPRSLWGQVWTLALQPNNFFLALPQTASSARQWFWVAVLILALNGMAAVRQEALKSGNGDSGSAPPVSDFGGVSGPSGMMTNITGGGGGMLIQPDMGPAPDFGGPSVSENPATNDVSSTWVTALISGSHIILGWFVLALFLCEIPLFNGVRPSYGQNLQIAIWTTVPLGLMAGLQLIYYAAGGTLGADGVSGLLTLWEGYSNLPAFVQSVLLSLTSRVTLFWIWTLVLVYIGGRTALEGKWWAVMIVVVAWVIVLAVMPVVTGAVAAPPQPETNLPSDPMMGGEMFVPDGGAFDGSSSLEDSQSTEPPREEGGFSSGGEVTTDSPESETTPEVMITGDDTAAPEATVSP
ncbi:MAG: YIP1 family protein [Anaerolineae bacterium]|nr:YIP1 family protein [Anaerolineae bacterium]